MNPDPDDLKLDPALSSGDMFLNPIPIPSASVDDDNLLVVEFNEDYAPIIALALQRLLYYDAWQGEKSEIERVTTEIDHLISLFLVGL